MPPESPREDRLLGVVEALVAVRDQCPHGAVRDHASRALDALRAGGSGVVREQAMNVLATLAGWRGERADLVKRSLEHFLADGA